MYLPNTRFFISPSDKTICCGDDADSEVIKLASYSVPSDPLQDHHELHNEAADQDHHVGISVSAIAPTPTFQEAVEVELEDTSVLGVGVGEEVKF